MARLKLEPSETLIGFCRRVSDALRQTKDRVTESGTEQVVATVRMTVYEELAVETVLHELPERLRNTVKAGKPSTLEEVIHVVREEEVEREERRYRQKEERKPVGESVRPRRSYAEVARPLGPRTRPAVRKEWEETRNRGPPRPQERGPRLRCWECGSEGHFARDCKYRYPRRPYQERSGFGKRRDMVEPMEVNAVEKERPSVRRGYRRVAQGKGPGSLCSGSVSSDEESSPSRRDRSESETEGRADDWKVVPATRYPWRRPQKTQKLD